MRIAPFTVDITPPLKQPLAYGPNTKVDSPVYLRGLVLEDGPVRAVLCSADLIGLYGPAYPQWRKALAAAAKVPERNFLIHSVHQHDSMQPLAPELVKQVSHYGDSVANEARGWEELIARGVAGLRDAVRPGKKGAWLTVEGLGTAERRLSQLASNRRMIGKDGKLWTTRWSQNVLPELWREPVGLIDPILRSIGFYGPRGKLAATLHFYATHPQVSHGRFMAGADVPGAALDALYKQQRGAGTHAYFTGCAGDITFGKYTLGADKVKNKTVLGARLGAGLVANTQALTSVDAGKLSLRHLTIPVALNPLMGPARHKPELAKATSRYGAGWQALFLHIAQNWKRYGHATIARLSLGPKVHVLSLPAENAVAYQLYAQSLIPEHFLACAGYGDGTLHYICTDEMFPQGGYEPGVSFAKPGFEKPYKAAIAQVLSDLQ